MRELVFCLSWNLFASFHVPIHVVYIRNRYLDRSGSRQHMAHSSNVIASSSIGNQGVC